MSPNIHAQKYMRCIGLGAAAAISAGASLAAGGATLWANSNMNKKNQKWNEKMVKQSRQWQEKMYNQYNSPQAQAQQLAAAGVNPYNQGGASTTPMSMSTSAPSLEQNPNDFGFIGEAGANVANTLLQKPAMEAQTLANRETEVRIEGMLTDNRIKLYDEMMRAIDAGNYEYATMLNNERIREDIRLSKASRKEKLQSRKNLEIVFDILVEEHKEKVRNNQLGDAAAAAGINPFITEDRLRNKQIDKIEADIASVNADTDTKNFALSMARKFDEKFLALDYQARQKEVQEFLDTSEVRVALHNVQMAFSKFAVDEATRQDALAQIKYEYDKHIAETILDAVKDGDSALDAVLIKMFAENPSGTLQTLISMGASFKPNITNNSYTTNKSTVYKY